MSVPVSILVDGQVLSAEAGLPLGALLHRACGGVLRRAAGTGAPRGLFCGTGVCFECCVTLNGRPGVRACLTPIQAGMTVETGTR